MSTLVRGGSHNLLAGIGLGSSLLAISILVAMTPAGGRWNGDVELFHHYAGTFLQGSVNKTDFLSWYPPLVLLPITLPRLIASGLPIYAFFFAMEMSVVAGVLVVIVGRLSVWARTEMSAPSAVAWLAGLTLLTAAVLPWRYDVIPAVAVGAALLAVVGEAPLAAGVFLGVGTALKVWPAAVLPAMLAWYWLRGDRRSTAWTLLGFGLAAGVGFGLYLFFAPVTPWDLLRFQGGRPLQLESIPASVIGLLAQTGTVPMPAVSFQDFSYDLIGPAAQVGIQVLTIAGPIVLLATFAATAWAFRRSALSEPSLTRLAVGLAAAILALILSNRVLSPQYVIWLLPVIPFMPQGFRVASAAAFAMTAATFPFLYGQLIRMELLPLAVLGVRNALLVGIWVAALVWLIRSAGRSVAEASGG